MEIYYLTLKKWEVHGIRGVEVHSSYVRDSNHSTINQFIQNRIKFVLKILFKQSTTQ